MKVLALDTATPAASAALVDGTRVVAECLLHGQKNHSERLLQIIDCLFEISGTGRDAIELIAVSVGPGSFTGLRVGISTAQGLAFALGRPLAGIPTLEVLAAQAVCGDMLLSPLIDARRQQVYAALYRRCGDALEQVRAPQALDPLTWVENLPGAAALIGSGAAVYHEQIRSAALAKGCIMFSEYLGIPRASTVAMLAQAQYKKGGAGAPELVRALYVRPPDALIAEC